MYVRRGESPEFLETSSPTDDDVQRLVETVAHRVIHLLGKRGVLDGYDVDPFFEESPALAGMTAASVHGWVATGDAGPPPYSKGRTMADERSMLTFRYVMNAPCG